MRVTAEAHRSERPFKVVVNDLLRTGLSVQRSAEKQAPFSVQSHDLGGLRPGLSLDSISTLLEELEGPAHR